MPLFFYTSGDILQNEIIKGIFIPFFGTALGSACVFFINSKIKSSLTRFFSGFAAGVMVAASVWSLLLPALENSGHLGIFNFFPAAAGFLTGVISLILTDRYIPLERFCFNGSKGANRIAMLVLAVTAHNLPEGIAVGAVYAGLLAGNTDVTIAGALTLSIGIGLQNFPEGAIISMPLYSSGVSRGKSFLIGALSGVVEPLGAVLALIAAKYLSILPFLLSFAAGAMIYVVVSELIPEISDKNHSVKGVLSFTLGFLLMMILDVTLG